MTPTSVSDLGGEARYGFVTSAVRKGLIFAFGVLFVRLLGPELYGLWVAFDTVVNPASLVATMGGSHLLIKELSEADAGRDTVRSSNHLTAYLLLTLLIGIALVLPLSFASGFVATLLGDFSHLDAMLGLLGWMIVLYAARRMSPSVFLGLGETTAMFRVRDIYEPIAKFGGLGVLALLLATDGPEWLYIVIPEAAGALCIVLPTVLVVRRNIDFGLIGMRETMREAGSVLRQGSPLVAHGMVSIAFLYSDKAMIAGMIGDAVTLSAYNVALTLAVLIMLFHRTLVKVVSPPISKARERDEREVISSIYRSSAEVGFLLAAGAFVCLMVFASELLSLYDPGFSDYALVIVIVGWAHLFDTFAGCGGYLLIAHDRERFLMYNSAFTVVLNLGLNWILISRYGVYGAAVGTMLSYLVKNGLIVAENFFTDGYHPISWRHLTAICVTGGATVLYWILGGPTLPLGMRALLAAGAVAAVVGALLASHREFLVNAAPAFLRNWRK